MEDDGIDIDEVPQTVPDPSCQKDVQCPDTDCDPSCVASQHPEESDINVKGLKGQIRLTELLKVIAHNKCMAKGTLTGHQQQEDNPGPSGPSLSSTLKPLKKAKYSWQVKNHMGQKSTTTANPVKDDSLLIETDQEQSSVAGVSDPTEPPPKKVKLSNDVDSSPAGTCTKETNTDDYLCQPAATPIKDDPTLLCSNVIQLDQSVRGTGPNRNFAETSKEKEKGQSQQPCLPQSTPSTPSGTAQQTGVFARWQGRHIAQSIVDNAINATLEVLGFSFASDTRNPTQTISAAQRQNLEDDAVSVVIQARGLQGTETVGDGHRVTSHNLLPNNLEQRSHPSGEVADIAEHSGRHFDDRITHIPQIARSSLLDPQETRSSLLEPIINHLRHLPQPIVDVDDSAVSSVSVSMRPVVGEAHCDAATAEKVCDEYEDLDNLFTPALQTDVLNKAVSAAISQKGLAMDGPL